MKYKEYLEEAKKLLSENPDLAACEVVTSIDDEGNGFNRVFYGPGSGVFDDGDFDQGFMPANAVCLN